MKQSEREQQMKKLSSEITKKVRKLKTLGYSYEDSASTIILFDNKMFQTPYQNLTFDEREKTQVGTLE